MRLKHRTAAVLLCLLIFAGCDENAAKHLNQAAHAIGIVQAFAIDAQRQGIMTKAEASTVVEATLRLSESGKAAVAVVRAIEEGDPESKTAAIDALGIVADQLAQLQGRLNIKSDTARRQVEAGLLLVSSSLNTARIIIAASDPK